MPIEFREPEDGEELDFGEFDSTPTTISFGDEKKSFRRFEQEDHDSTRRSPIDSDYFLSRLPGAADQIRQRIAGRLEI